MRKLIKDSVLSENNWRILRTAEECQQADLAQGNYILPLPEFEAFAKDTKGTSLNAVWISTDNESSTLETTLDKTPLVCIDFPAFTDGRGFSIARSLRETYDYQGEIRAIGNFIQDQLFYLARCGVNSFELSEDIDVESALESLADFSVKYQAAIDEPQPLFRRRN